jgi:predicted AAA+ superfamily ATPase
MQYIKKNFRAGNKVLYTSLDHFWFTENRLYNLADEFDKKGGELLALDEVHRYNNWATELKNIYDDFPALKIVFTGSSLLQLNKARADLSRRAVMYSMPGLSFREFINFETKHQFPIFQLEDILNNHIEIAISVLEKIRPLETFSNYLDYGYYPFYLENRKSFHQKLSEAVLTVLEVDIAQFESIQTSNIVLLKKLLQVISSSVPFKPNYQTLSERTGISKNTLKNYLKYLESAKIISMLTETSKGLKSLAKPEKIYLQNTNLMFNLSGDQHNLGNLRETFFMENIEEKHTVRPSVTADFLVNDRFTFEIGGKNKGKTQIKDIPNSYIVKDDIEVGSNNIIPLWLFGFLY